MSLYSAPPSDRCEAMLKLPSGERHVWTRCGKQPVETHHRLTRARGGLILDGVGETYHLISLCRACHTAAHQQSGSSLMGLLIDGYVTTRMGTPYYNGPDHYLTRLYGRKDRR